MLSGNLRNSQIPTRHIQSANAVAGMASISIAEAGPIRTSEAFNKASIACCIRKGSIKSSRKACQCRSRSKNMCAKVYCGLQVVYFALDRLKNAILTR